MLKIVSSLNGFSLCQSVVSDGPKYRAAVAVKNILFFKKNLLFFKKKKKTKNDFLVEIFFCSSSVEDDLTNNLTSLHFPDAQESRGLGDVYKRQPMEDDLTNNLTSLHFPESCVRSI